MKSEKFSSSVEFLITLTNVNYRTLLETITCNTTLQQFVLTIMKNNSEIVDIWTTKHRQSRAQKHLLSCSENISGF